MNKTRYVHTFVLKSINSLLHWSFICVIPTFWLGHMAIILKLKQGWRPIVVCKMVQVLTCKPPWSWMRYESLSQIVLMCLMLPSWALLENWLPSSLAMLSAACHFSHSPLSFSSTLLCVGAVFTSRYVYWTRDTWVQTDKTLNRESVISPCLCVCCVCFLHTWVCAHTV